MRIFDRDGKTNFVDDNNVFVGFDNYQCCCEDFGHLVTKSPPKSEHPDDEVSGDDFPGYQFNTEFFEENGFDDLYEGGSVCFKLEKDGEPDLYLTLFNIHNGYYSHGFTMTAGGVELHSDYL